MDDDVRLRVEKLAIKKFDVLTYSRNVGLDDPRLHPQRRNQPVARVTSSIANYRLTRARGLAALALATLGFVVVFLVLTRITGPAVPLLTGEGYGGQGGCYLNFFVDELVVDPVNGTAVIESYTVDGQPKTRTLPIMWPSGYTARRSGSEVEVLAWNGDVVARTGATYRIQGGYEGNVWRTCSMMPMLNWTPNPAL